MHEMCKLRCNGATAAIRGEMHDGESLTLE